MGNFKPFKILFSGMGIIFLLILGYLFLHWVGVHVSFVERPISDSDFKQWVIVLLVVIACKSGGDCNCNCKKG